MKICLTGGIACGKSLLSHYLNELGVETIDADDVVHELIPDPAERRRLAAEVFSDPEKRKALEAKIHPIVKARIEEFLSQCDAIPASSPCRPCRPSCRPNGEGLPTFDSRLSPVPSQSVSIREIRGSRSSHPLRLAIIPLLFETHWDAEYDIICCVVSEKEVQIARMTTTRGYSREEAEARLAAQMPVEEKAKRSHYVIHNNGTPEELKEKTKAFVSWLQTR